jgi:hypothetical protein
MPARVVMDSLGNPGRAALVRGPLVYAADQAFLPQGVLLEDIVMGLDFADPAAEIEVRTDPATGAVHLEARRLVMEASSGAGWWSEPERYHDLTGKEGPPRLEPVTLLPFYAAGNKDAQNFKEGIHPNYERVSHITYQVWLPYRFV